MRFWLGTAVRGFAGGFGIIPPGPSIDNVVFPIESKEERSENEGSEIPAIVNTKELSATHAI